MEGRDSEWRKEFNGGRGGNKERDVEWREGLMEGGKVE